MPTYQYRCKGCGADLEVVQSFTDDALTTCEACGGQLRKVFGSVGISFKGTGFYKTDNRSGGGSRSSSAAGSSESAGANGSSDTGSSSGESATKADSASKGDGAKGSGGDKAPAKAAS